MISCQRNFCSSLWPSLKLLVRHFRSGQYLRTACEVCHPLRHNSIPFIPRHIPDFKNLYHCSDYYPSSNYTLPFCDSWIFNSIMAENKFIIGYAKLGTSSCKKCKQKIAKQSLRIGKVVPNPFGDGGGDMKQWHHPACIFETFKRARASTKIIEEPDDLEGFTDLQDEDKKLVNKLIKGNIFFLCWCFFLTVIIVIMVVSCVVKSYPARVLTFITIPAFTVDGKGFCVALMLTL